jgi:hypothetical protein
MYRCSRCRATMSQPLDRCPSCGALLSGVKCEACGYIGGKSEFIKNNHRCPKCQSIAHIPSIPRPSPSKPSKPSVPRPSPSKPSKPYVPGLFMAIVGLVLTCIFPILAGLLCIYVALKAEKKAAKVLGWVGFALNVIPLLILIVGAIADRI